MNHFDRLIAAGCLGIATVCGASTASSSPAVQEVTIDCSVSSNNDGCQTTVACPAGTKIWTAKAACNLEYGSVSDEAVASVVPGYVKVVRSSDHVEEAQCWVGGTQIGSGEVVIAKIGGLTSLSVGCQEHDKNGGDCHIRGVLYCE
jgi:hypothetical protein